MSVVLPQGRVPSQILDPSELSEASALSRVSDPSRDSDLSRPPRPPQASDSDSGVRSSKPSNTTPAIAPIRASNFTAASTGRLPSEGATLSWLKRPEKESAEGFGVDVLAFGPHPDDVEMFCGGSLISLAQLGYSTAIIDLTRGERATRGTPEIRAKEAEAAAQVMGLRFRENLGFPDTGISSGSGEDALNPSSQLSKVVSALRRHRPEFVLIPWREERHPDHVAASELVSKAVFYAGVGGFPSTPSLPRHVPRQVLYYALRYQMNPSFIFDISAAASRKMEAMLSYQSQLASGAGLGPQVVVSAEAREGIKEERGDGNLPPPLIGSPQALQAIDARDRYYGSMIGVSHGEAFRLANVLGLSDPIRHFRDNPYSQAHAFEPLR